MTILLVDDDPVSLRLLQLTLEKSRFDVACASTATDAIRWLDRNPAELIITDLNLGGTSGLGLFDAVRSDPRWRQLPVLLCTGADDPAIVEGAIAHGIRHYVVKPIKPAYLLQKVTQILAEQGPIIEHRFEAMARLGLAEHDYVALLGATAAHLDTLTDTLERAQASGDPAALREALRRLREPLELVQAPRCLAALAALAAFTGFDATPDGPQHRAAVETLVEELQSLRTALSQSEGTEREPHVA